MDILTYKGLEIHIPTSFTDVPFNVYEEVHKMRPETIRQHVDVPALICGVESEVLLKAPAEIMDVIIERIMFIFRPHDLPPAPGFKFEDVTYVCEVERSLTVAEWVDIEQAQKQETDVLSTVMSIICRPAGEEYDPNKSAERVEIFKRAPSNLILPVLAFFLRRKEKLEKLTNAYLSAKRAAELLPLNIKSLRSLGDGIKLSQIWRMIIYYYSIKLLRYRLARFSRLLYIDVIKIRRLKRKKI